MRPYRLIIGVVVALGAAALLPTVSAHAAANLVSNPSVEAAGAGGQPADWTFNRWGTNTATSTWKTGGRDGQRSLAVTVSGYASGDAKWVSAPVTVKPGTRYEVSDWYVATVATSLEAVYTDGTGKQTYAWLADAPASGAWRQVAAAFTPPAGSVKVSIYHVLERNGTLQTDAYALTEGGGSTTPPPAPTVTVTAPAAGATVSGTEQITATASADVVGVRLQVDGVDLGAEDFAAPFAAGWDTTKSANGARTVTALARTADNRTASTSITVTVNNASAPAPPPAPQPGNLIANPSVDSGSGGSPSGWTGVRWGTNTATFGWLTSGRTGARSVRTEITAYTNGDARWHHAPATVTPGRTYQYTGWYQSNVATEIDVEVTMTNGTKQYVYLATVPASTAWAKATAQYTAPAGAAKVIVYQVLSRKGWLVGDDFALTEYAPTELRRGMVSLTFDDGWVNQLTNAAPLLDRYAMKATFYVLTGTTDWNGYMTRDQMGTLAAAGHEIASHTVSHAHLTTLSASALDGELKNSRASLRQWYGPSVAKNFASPYGEYNAAVQAASRTYYRSHRSTDEGFNTEDDTDVDNLRVQNILDSTTPAQVDAWVDQAIRDRSWLILVYHEVGTGLADPTYAVTPANLDAELRLIRDKGVAVRTVDQALDEIVPQLG